MAIGNDDSSTQASGNLFATILLVGWIWGAYFLNYCDRQAVFSMFTVLKTDLEMTDQQLGLTGSFFLWVYGIGCPIAGYLADRYSKTSLVIASLVVWSLVTIATGLSISGGMLLGMRAAMGISEALFMPAAIALTSLSTPTQWRSRAIASLTTAQIAGIIGGSWFGGWMSQHGYWRASFFILGGVGLVYAIPFAWALRSSVADSRANIAEGLDHSNVAAWNPISLLRIPTFTMLCLIFPLFVFGLWMIYSWLSKFIEETFQLSASEAALTSTLYLQTATMVGLFFGGYLADRLCKILSSGRLCVLFSSLLLCAPLLYAIGQVDRLDLLKWILVAFGFSSGWMMGNIFPAAFEVVPKEQRATAVGLLNLFGALLSGFAPLMVGTWKQSLGLPGMLGVAAIAYCIAAVLMVATIFLYFPNDLTLRKEQGAP